MLVKIFLALLVIVLLSYLWLRIRNARLAGDDLSIYDSSPQPFAVAEPSAGLERINAYIREMFVVPAEAGKAGGGWTSKRERFDEAGLKRGKDFEDIEFRPDVITVDGRDIPGSWTLAPGYDAARRLLYMHGGAFTVGSDISHRPLTVQLARRTGMAVFAPNYRLMPENTRREGIEDTRAAYNWILDNGPDGAAPAAKLALAGDSAGGNLVLMLANWARNHAPRAADAVIAFSPTTDASLSAPSIRGNLATDHMLRPMFQQILKAPKLMLLPSLQHYYGMSPSDPDQSPIFDDLSNLPPILIQASTDEVLFDDAVRFANKAKAAGSPVTLQAWAGGLPHVWQLFDDYLPEALTALDEVQEFLSKYT